MSQDALGGPRRSEEFLGSPKDHKTMTSQKNQDIHRNWRRFTSHQSGIQRAIEPSSIGMTGGSHGGNCLGSPILDSMRKS